MPSSFFRALSLHNTAQVPAVKFWRPVFHMQNSPGPVKFGHVGNCGSCKVDTCGSYKAANQLKFTARTDCGQNLKFFKIRVIIKG